MSLTNRILLHNSVALLALCSLWFTADAASYLTYVRDLLSTSAPSAGASQTITFRLVQAVPASGSIVLDFAGGGFTIPAFGFDYRELDVAYRATSLVAFTDRPLSTSRNAVTDGVAVTTGTNGLIRINLNTSTGIPAGNEGRAVAAQLC